MKIQESGEMYLENIFVLGKKQAHVRAIDVVNMTGYSKPSISRALGILKQNGMILVDRDGHITLTEEGHALAVKIYERHNILSRCLEKIGVDSETAASDACRIEHVISDETFEKIKKFVEN